MRPLLRLPLCASARISAPVFSSTHRHPLPQVARIGAAERRQRREGLDQAGLRAVVAPDDVAMKIVAAGVRGPLIADEGGETARLVGLFRRLDGLAPGAAIGGRARRREALRQLALAEAGDDIDGRLRAFAGIDLVVPFPALRRRQQARIAAHQLREKAHAVRVVGHDQEIQRPRKLGALSAGGDDLFALGETIGILRAEPSTERARVHRKRGVQMRVAEVRPRREIAPRIRRVGRLGGKHLLGRLLVERADVGGYGLLGGEGRQCEDGGHRRGANSSSAGSAFSWRVPHYSDHWRDLGATFKTSASCNAKLSLLSFPGLTGSTAQGATRSRKHGTRKRPPGFPDGLSCLTVAPH